jgi:predicted ATPase/DNA-binding winged helix-turn-helix (wHTH) protein
VNHSPQEDMVRSFCGDKAATEVGGTLRAGAEPSRDTRRVISFGPFRLLPAERLLESAGAPVHLGARALDILITLTERAGEVVSKQELMARVWPEVTVDEGSLRFHVSSLRKALGDGRPGARYITTLPGRGYFFVAQTSHSNETETLATPSSIQDRFRRLPACLRRMIGRDDTVKQISARLLSEKFVTIVGPGGIGKTTVAVSVSHGQMALFEGAVHFFDLGRLNDPVLLPTALASTLGLPDTSNDATRGLTRFLRDKRMLLVIDNCEHVIEAAARLAERIFDEAPGVHILATSREPLRVEGEHVHRLSALDSPPQGTRLTATEALDFSAAQLFADRVVAYGCRLELAAHTSIIGAICRQMDGIPLALELAAGQVDAYGIHETAALLDGRSHLLGSGRRTAPHRHQTLSATLDWSYNLLTDRERMVLRQLSIFFGIFTLEAARSVVADDSLDHAQMLDDLASLVSKSLVDAKVDDATACYWLLNTTRVYAFAKLVDSGEAAMTARRHEAYLLESPEVDSAKPTSGAGKDARCAAPDLSSVVCGVRALDRNPPLNSGGVDRTLWRNELPYRSRAVADVYENQ